MESYKLLISLLEILKETLKIFSKNVLLMASLTLLSLSLYSIFYISNVFSTEPLILDIVVKGTLIPVTDPTSPGFANLVIGFMHDLRAFVAFEWTYVITISATSLFFSTATIIASAVTHRGENLFFKELFLLTIRSLKRSFVTWFYITLLGLGYSILVLENILPMVLIIQQPIALKALFIILVILAAILYNYLAVIWSLAFVISVMEENCGIEALGKAAQIVKGKQLLGFRLNLLFTVLNLILLQGLRLMTVKQSVVHNLPLIIGLVVVNCIRQAKLFCWMAYTIFYLQCKETQGEEVQLQGKTEYSKIPTVTVDVIEII